MTTEKSDMPHKTDREMFFENERVQVWKTTIAPHQPLNMHRHDAPRVVIVLKGGKLTKVESTGETSPLHFETGQAYWLDKDPTGTAHVDLNESEESIEVMVVQFRE